MVKSACGIEAVYMCFNRTAIWGGETTRGIFGASSEFVWGDVHVSLLKKSAFCNFIPGSTLMLLHYYHRAHHQQEQAINEEG